MNKEIVEELEKLYSDCRLQERIITQLKLKEIIEKIKNDTCLKKQIRMER